MRGFTLIEMMVVIAVLVTLMMIVFRLSNISNESQARVDTITRLQRLENCLSGFHAAFGCYPPVRLHGNRSFAHQHDTHGNETSINWGNESEAWSQVQGICKAQPIACNFPLRDDKKQIDLIRELSDFIKSALASGEFDDDLFSSEAVRNWAAAGFMSSSDPAVVGKLTSGENAKKVLWDDVQVFRYGVMSYLLPRYLIMMQGDEQFYSNFAQWDKNNDVPSDPYEGDKDKEWSDIRNDVENANRTGDKKNIAWLSVVPSQAVCARWMPNLEGICTCNFCPEAEFFGIDISGGGSGGSFGGKLSGGLISALRDATFSPYGLGSNRDQYLLGSVTVQDGWGTEFFYYSRSPYQSYTLWSAGPDGKTFPPWIARDKLPSDARRLAEKWTKDDVIHMSN